MPVLLATDDPMVFLSHEMTKAPHLRHPADCLEDKGREVAVALPEIQVFTEH